MVSMKKQCGLSSLSLIIVALVAIVTIISVIKIGPVYIESLTVRSILNQVADETRGEGLNRSQIYDRIEKKFLINTVSGVVMKDVRVKSNHGEVTIDARYEVRKHLFFNLDVVVVFEDMTVSVQRV